MEKGKEGMGDQQGGKSQTRSRGEEVRCLEGQRGRSPVGIRRSKERWKEEMKQHRQTEREKAEGEVKLIV